VAEALLALAAAAALLAWKFPRLRRWFRGHPLDGRLRTNATWNRAATKVLHPTGHALPWHHWRQRELAAVRAGLTVLGLAVAVGLAVNRTGTLLILAAGVLLLAGLRLPAGISRGRAWQHHRTWVRPTRRALTHEMGIPPVRLEIAEDRSRVLIGFGPEFTGAPGMRQAITRVVCEKMGKSGYEPDWSMDGESSQVTYTLAQPPPGYVSFADILPYTDAAEEHEIILGLGRPSREHPNGVPGQVSVDSDSPHIGLSMGSGDGKSVTARNAASQLAHHGSLIAVLDNKFISQHWAAGLRNVAYARTAQEIHEMALWLYGEVIRRKELTLQYADVEGVVHADPGPRIVAILEELNVTQSELAAYWKSIGGKGRSPAVEALDKVSFIGRQVLVNLLYIGQRLSAKATSGGSGDARENLGVLLMSNPAASTWKMLVGDRHALPAATDVQGRLQVVSAKTVTEIQGAYVTGQQARDYATSGEVAVPRDDMPCVGGLAPVGTPERAAQHVPDMLAIGTGGPDLHVVRDSPGPPPLPPRITIGEAVAEGISGPTYDAVRKALSRDEGAPQPVGRRGNADEYDRVQWCDWEELRRQPRRAGIR
jgi:hypothetical protein